MAQPQLSFFSPGRPPVDDPGPIAAGCPGEHAHPALQGGVAVEYRRPRVWPGSAAQSLNGGTRRGRLYCAAGHARALVVVPPPSSEYGVLVDSVELVAWPQRVLMIRIAESARIEINTFAAVVAGVADVVVPGFEQAPRDPLLKLRAIGANLGLSAPAMPPASTALDAFVPPCARLVGGGSALSRTSFEAVSNDAPIGFAWPRTSRSCPPQQIVPLTCNLGLCVTSTKTTTRYEQLMIRQMSETEQPMPVNRPATYSAAAVSPFGIDLCAAERRAYRATRKPRYRDAEAGVADHRSLPALLFTIDVDVWSSREDVAAIERRRPGRPRARPTSPMFSSSKRGSIATAAGCPLASPATPRSPRIR